MDQLLAFAVQSRYSVSQIFKTEVPRNNIIHRMQGPLLWGQHRFKLTFTKMPFVPLGFRLLPFPILLEKIRNHFCT